MADLSVGHHDDDDGKFFLLFFSECGFEADVCAERLVQPDQGINFQTGSKRMNYLKKIQSMFRNIF